MKAKCYFCDRELEVVAHTFKTGLKEEPVCEECYLKTVNRRRAREDEKGSGEA
jgi:uncharacterized protein YlaI